MSQHTKVSIIGAGSVVFSLGATYGAPPSTWRGTTANTAAACAVWLRKPRRDTAPLANGPFASRDDMCPFILVFSPASIPQKKTLVCT